MIKDSEYEEDENHRPGRMAHTRRKASGEGAFGKLGQMVLSSIRIWGTMPAECLAGNSPVSAVLVGWHAI